MLNRKSGIHNTYI